MRRAGETEELEVAAGICGGAKRGNSCRLIVSKGSIKVLGVHCTYRAFELGPFASSALNNVVQADLCVANVFTFGLARDRAWCSIPAAVSIHAIAVIICETPMCAGSTALET
jgi:hypothetical protein